jgi:hypothetical protein
MHFGSHRFGTTIAYATLASKSFEGTKNISENQLNVNSGKEIEQA